MSIDYPLKRSLKSNIKNNDSDSVILIDTMLILLENFGEFFVSSPLLCYA
jgi:hypothetical protein